MNWETLSLHFKQSFEGGYRYLDRCGEFLLAAEDALKFIPKEPKPSGASMEIPDMGVNASVDTIHLSVTQEFPKDDSGYFIDLCKDLSKLVSEKFEPRAVFRNGFACKSYQAFDDIDAMLSATLQFGGTAHSDLSGIVDMIPEHQKLDYTFASGSKRLHIVMQPVTFDRAGMVTRNAGFQSSKIEKERISRANQFTARAPTTLAHGLVLELDLMEDDPARDADLKQHWEELLQKSVEVGRFFQIA